MVRNRRTWVVVGKKYEGSPFEKLMQKEPLEKCQKLLSVALRTSSATFIADLNNYTTVVFTKLSICSSTYFMWEMTCHSKILM